MAENRVTWRMPPLGDGVDSVIIQEWMVDVGEAVMVGETLVVVESDKATAELDSPLAGTLVTVLAQEGAEVAIGQPLAELDRA